MDLVKGDMQRSDRGGYSGRGKMEAGDLLSSQKKRRRIPDKKFFLLTIFADIQLCDLIKF